MNEIRRWDVETLDQRTSSNGYWVAYDDHAAEVDRLRAENQALRSGIEKALDEIEDDGPKALKYAAQELRAAMEAK